MNPEEEILIEKDYYKTGIKIKKRNSELSILLKKFEDSLYDSNDDIKREPCCSLINLIFYLTAFFSFCVASLGFLLFFILLLRLRN